MWLPPPSASAPVSGGRLDERRGLDRDWRGRILGDPPANFATLQQRFDDGWRFAAGGVDEGASSEPGLILLRQSGALIFNTTEGEEEAAAEAGTRICQLPPCLEQTQSHAQQSPAAALLA